jgi:hypothetical protein
MTAFAPITDMMLKLRKVMEDMKKKPKKKRANPTVMRIYVLKTTKIQLGICLD